MRSLFKAPPSTLPGAALPELPAADGMASPLLSALSGLARFIPPQAWEQVAAIVGGELQSVRAVLVSIDNRLADLQARDDQRGAELGTLKEVIRCAVPEAGLMLGEYDASAAGFAPVGYVAPELAAQ